MGLLKNLLTGKTAFEVPQSEPSGGSNNSSNNQNSNQPAQTTPSGPKEIPQVAIERTECHVNGSNMRVECVIQNNSAGSLFIDNILLLGKTVNLKRDLAPAREWEFTVYNGPIPNNQNYNTAELKFRKSSDGDYFSRLFRIDYDTGPNGTYVIRHFVPTGQRDT